MPNEDLTSKVEKYTAKMAFVSKKLICCPPDDTLSNLMTDLLPLAEDMVEVCQKYLGK